MSDKDGARRPPRRRGDLRVERLEARGLLSVVPIFMSRAHLAGHAAPPAGDGSTGGVAATAAVGQPTPHELAREQFGAKASGRFLTGPGRFTNQKLQVSFEGTGGSNQSLHLDLQIRYFVPLDPAQPITGVASLIPRNSSTTGSSLFLDLTAPQSGTAGPSALPGHFTWTVDPTSGGLYTAAGGFGTGQGTLDIHYVTTGKGRTPALTSGRAFVVVKGLINSDGIFSNVGGPGNTPRNP